MTPDEFGLRIDLSGVAELLRPYVAEMLDRLGPSVAMPDDPLAALQQSQSEPADRPDDPVMARLLPDGVMGDEDAAAEFRRFSHASLRERKRQDARLLIALLDDGGGSLDWAQALSLMGGINDLRLMLGTALMVSQDDDFEPRSVEDAAAYQAYQVAAYLQEELVAALDASQDEGTS